MGNRLYVELDKEIDNPPEFLNWGSSGLLDAFAMGYEVFGFGSILDLFADRLKIHLKPLHRVTNPDLRLDDFIECIDPENQDELNKWKQRYYEFDERRKNAWQSPSELLESLEQLIKALDEHPGVFEEVGVDPDRYGNNFLTGVFRKELDHLLRIVLWADQKNIQKLRMIWL